MNILVTGGAGFIGSHVVDALIAQGHRVVVVDNLSTGNKKNVHSKAKFYKIDIRSEKLASIFSEHRPDTLIHHAAQMDVRHSVMDPSEDADINILGSINVFSCAASHGVTKIIFASSGGAIYGDTKHLPTSESEPLLPASPYGIAKLAGEQYLRYTATQLSCPWIALRYANVYGPRQNSTGEAGVVAMFTDAIVHGKQPVINGSGSQTRDFVCVDDVVRANLAALRSRHNGIYNIGTGVETNVNQIFQLIRTALCSRVRATNGPAKHGEQKRSCLDARRAAKELGWEPQVGLEEGIERTVKWFRQQ